VATALAEPSAWTFPGDRSTAARYGRAGITNDSKNSLPASREILANRHHGGQAKTLIRHRRARNSAAPLCGISPTGPRRVRQFLLQCQRDRSVGLFQSGGADQQLERTRGISCRGGWRDPRRGAFAGVGGLVNSRTSRNYTPRVQLGNAVPCIARDNGQLLARDPPHAQVR